MIEFPFSARLEVLKVALPELRVPWPRTVAPSRKVTVPAGVPVPVDFTVAVNVTFCPNTDGSAEDVRVVVEPKALTTWITAPEVLPPKSESPP